MNFHECAQLHLWFLQQICRGPSSGMRRWESPAAEFYHGIILGSPIGDGRRDGPTAVWIGIPKAPEVDVACIWQMDINNLSPDTAINTWGSPGLGGQGFVFLQHQWCLSPGPCLLLALMWLRNREEIFPRSSVRCAFTHLPQSIHLNCEYLLKVKCFSSHGTF